MFSVGIAQHSSRFTGCSGGAIDHGHFNEGSVYIFRARGKEWQEIFLLTGDPATAFLGAAVALRKDTVVAGAPAFVDYTGTRSTGAGYVFRTR